MPADSLIQYFYCLAVTHSVNKALPFTLVTDNRGSYSVVHIVAARENIELEITHTRSLVLTWHLATARQVRFNIGNIYEIDNFGKHRSTVWIITDRSARYICMICLSVVIDDYGCKVVYFLYLDWDHYNGVIMNAMTSQITSLTIVYSSFIQTKIKKTHQFPRQWPLCKDFPAQRASNARLVSIWWRHHGWSHE